MIRDRADILRTLWLALLSLGLVEAGVLADSIEQAGGKRLDGVEIVQARWDSVQYRQGNKPPMILPGSQVVAIERSSAVLDKIRQLVREGDLAKAEENLKSVPATPPGLAAEAMYLVGEGYLRAGKAKDAARVLGAYLEKYKGEKDWFVPAATLGMAQACLADKQPGTAEVHFKALDAFGGSWKLYGILGQADALLSSRGKDGALDARRLYDEVARSRDATLELKQKALVGRGRAYLAQGQAQELIKELSQSMFDAPKPEELAFTQERAEATLLVAKAYQSLGGKENLEQAEIWYLRVAALYGKHAAAYAAACDGLVEVYGKLSQPARAQEWQARRGAKTGGGK